MTLIRSAAPGRAVPLVLLLVTGAGCAGAIAAPSSAKGPTASIPAAPPDVGAFGADSARASECGAVHLTAHPDPDALLTEFLARVGEGRVGAQDTWFVGAVACPALEPEGHERYQLTSGYGWQPLGASPDSAIYRLTLRSLGSYAGSFEASPAIVEETVVLHRTPYGWRVGTPAPTQWVSFEVALGRQWLTVSDLPWY